MKVVWLFVLLCSSMLRGAAQESLNCAENTDKLNFAEQAVPDLRFLVACKHVKKLYLSFNMIKDISPLANLTELEELWISYNPIKTLEPLLALNNLKIIALDMEQIERLKPQQWVSQDKVYVDIDERQIK